MAREIKQLDWYDDHWEEQEFIDRLRIEQISWCLRDLHQKINEIVETLNDLLKNNGGEE